MDDFRCSFWQYCLHAHFTLNTFVFPFLSPWAHQHFCLQRPLFSGKASYEPNGVLARQLAPCLGTSVRFGKLPSLPSSPPSLFNPPTPLFSSPHQPPFHLEIKKSDFFVPGQTGKAPRCAHLSNAQRESYGRRTLAITTLTPIYSPAMI